MCSRGFHRFQVPFVVDAVPQSVAIKTKASFSGVCDSFFFGVFEGITASWVIRGTKANFFVVGPIFEGSSNDSGNSHSPLLVFSFLHIIGSQLNNGTTPSIKTMDSVGKFNRLPTFKVRKALIPRTSTLCEVIWSKVMLQNIAHRR